MQILLQKRNDGLYLKGTLFSTRLPEEAREFPTSTAAIDYCVENTLEGVQLVLKFKDRHKDIVLPFLAPANTRRQKPSQVVRVEVAKLNKELADNLRRNPHQLHVLTPRAFEELVASVLEDMGCEVEITKPTRDGGRDLLAAFQTPLGRLLAIVECKRYRPDRCVGVDRVERFLYVVERKDNASCGLIATTSYFSPEAQALARELPYRLKLKDFEAIRGWISNYGNWSRGPNSDIWVPKWL